MPARVIGAGVIRSRVIGAGVIGVGVIGVGVMGAEHARLLHEEVSGGDVAGVFDVDRERASSVAARTDARTFDDPMSMINHDTVDAVLVASSDTTHERFVTACIEAGKPVLCEKPLAPDAAGCARIMAHEDRVGRRLVRVGFMRRYDPGYAQLRAAVREDQVGPALLLHCRHRNASARPGQPSELLISGSAVHEFDAARWLLDEEMRTVTVHRSRASARAGGTRDPLFIVVESVSGVLVDIEVFVNAAYGYEVSCELVGETGTVVLDAPPPTQRRSVGAVGRSLPADWRPRFAEAYRRELQQWVADLATGETDRGPSAWDGYAATEIAAAAIRSLNSGGPQPVTLTAKALVYR